GVIERRRLIDGTGVEPGDAVIGLASDGLHSNGFSLVRKALGRVSAAAWRAEPKGARAALPVDLGEPLIDAVLRPTRLYVRPILALLGAYRRKRVIRAMAHITGGGLEGNVPRVLPPRCDARLSRKRWPVPPVFRLLKHCGVANEELYRVFNMGIGYILIVRPAFADSVVRRLNKLGERAYRIGTIQRGRGRVKWR
ncbi:MAG: AIR synthase-related protein, partial [Phycisphaerae bacterium]